MFWLVNPVGGVFGRAFGGSPPLAKHMNIGQQFVFREQIGWLLARLAEMGANALLVVGGALALYLLLRWLRRWRFLRSLPAARIGGSGL